MSTIYTLNGKVLKNAANDKWLIKATPVDPYNPLGLPPFTIRCKFTSGYTPTMGDSQTLVDAGENVWDITKNSTDWGGLFGSNSSLLSILGANTTGVTNMATTFTWCTSLTSVPLFDTSKVTSMKDMFNECRSLTTIPLFDTNKSTNMYEMFRYCYKVESGALDLYRQASTQTTTVTSHFDTFAYCGIDTVTGSAELAQIPTSWGGTMA